MNLTRVNTAIRTVKAFLGYKDLIHIKHDSPDQIRVLIQSASLRPDHKRWVQVSLGILDHHLKTLRSNTASNLQKKASSPSMTLKRRMLELEHAAKIWPMPSFYIRFEKEAIDKLVETLRHSTSPPSSASDITLEQLVGQIQKCEKVKLCLGVHCMEFDNGEEDLKKIHYAHRWNQRTGIWTKTLASGLKNAISTLGPNLSLNHFKEDASNTVEKQYEKVHKVMEKVSMYLKESYELKAKMLDDEDDEDDKKTVEEISTIIKDLLAGAMVCIYKLMYLESHRSNAISFSN